MDHFFNIEIRTLWVFDIEISPLWVIRTGPYFKISSGPYIKVQIFWASHFNIQINMLKNGVLVGFGPSDPKENLILSLEHVKSNFKSDSALHCRAICKNPVLFIGCLKSGFESPMCPEFLSYHQELR